MWEVVSRTHNSVKRVLKSVKRVQNSVKRVQNSVKHVLNSVKHGLKVVKPRPLAPTKARGCIWVPDCSQDPYVHLYSTPLGSPTGVPELPYVHAREAPPAHAPLATARAAGRVRDHVRVYGWVYGRAIPGYYPPSHRALREQACTAKRAPEAPSGGWSGWYMGPSPSDRSPEHPGPTLRARSDPCRVLPGPGPSPRAKPPPGQ